MERAAAGLGFILPAMLIVLALAWLYQRFGTLPQAGWLLYGIKPVVIAIIIQAVWKLAPSAAGRWGTRLVAAAVLVLYFVGVNELVLLFGGGLLYMLVLNLNRLRERGASAVLLLTLASLPAAPLRAAAPLPAAAVLLASVPFSLATLFLSFLKIGALLYGSGYVLIAFLNAEFVERLGWLTESQLLDAIAIGQVTPGPLFTSATFIGYQLGGVPGALLATLGVFLPSFVYVAISNPFIPRMRRSPWLGALLDGVNAAAFALIAAVIWEIGRASLVDVLSVLIALISLVMLLCFKVNSTWLILGGALVGLVSKLI